VWAGANLGSYSQGVAVLHELAEVDLTGKQVQRMTSQIGDDCRHERALHVESFRARTLAERTAANPTADVPGLGVVMMDGGRSRGLFALTTGLFSSTTFSTRRVHSTATPCVQRRDHFGEPRTSDRKGHWREDKVGLALSMRSETFDSDPTPEFPAWLASAKVVSEIAKLAERSETAAENSGEKRAGSLPSDTAPDTASDSDSDSDSENHGDGENHDDRTWAKAPKLLRREMIASTEQAEPFGWHLEWKAWQRATP